METGSRKKVFEYFFEKVVKPMGFKFTPYLELKDFLLQQEVMLEAKHGIPFCPCQPVRKDRARRAFLSTGNISMRSNAAGPACLSTRTLDPASLPQLPPKDVGL